MGWPVLTFDQYAERFWSRVDKVGECWLWTGGTGHWGYGHFRAKALLADMGYREQLAHRWAWIFTHGPIPEDAVVMHLCDNPPCVRPEHLVLGSHALNAADRKTKGRNGDRRGERNGSAKLTADDVVAIRVRWIPGDRAHSTAAIARDYGVTQGLVAQIVRRKVWTHV